MGTGRVLLQTSEKNLFLFGFTVHSRMENKYGIDTIRLI